MSWTDEQERAWKELTDEREKQQKEVGRLHFIRVLRDTADKIEKGEDPDAEIKIEFVRGEGLYAYEGPAPIIGKRYTFYLPTKRWVQ